MGCSSTAASWRSWSPPRTSGTARRPQPRPAAPPPQDRSYAGPQDRGYQQGYDQHSDRRYDDRHDNRYDQRGYQQRPYTKKKSFLSELFDD